VNGALPPMKTGAVTSAVEKQCAGECDMVEPQIMVLCRAGLLVGYNGRNLRDMGLSVTKKGGDKLSRRLVQVYFLFEFFPVGICLQFPRSPRS